MWRVADGKQVAEMPEARRVQCLAVSNGGRWIAAGTLLGDSFVWDAETHALVFSQRDARAVNGVDFSPDSARRLASASVNGTATIWDISTRKRALTLHHEQHWVVRAAKYSPKGDLIATATSDSVRVWGSNDGHLLADIKITVTPLFDAGLLWFNHHLLVLSDSKIQQFEAYSGSTVSEWPVPENDRFSCVALPQHGEFIAHSTRDTVTFWDPAGRTQLSHIQQPQDIYSIALSPDDRFIALVDMGGKITVKPLARIIVSILYYLIVDDLCVPIVLRITSHPFSDPTPHSRHLSSRLTTLRLICGSMVIWRTRKHHWPQQSMHLRIQAIMHSPVELSS